MLTNKTHTSDSPSNLIRISWRAILLIATLLISSQSLAVQTITFYHNDVLGSPVAATDENGNICWREDYQPYGEKLENNDGHEPSTEGCGLDDNQRGYTGHVHDKDIGLTYMQARYYDPVVGRFMGMDPIGPVLGVQPTFNRYAYGGNNPYKYVDPDGKYPSDGIENADDMDGMEAKIAMHESRVDQRYDYRSKEGMIGVTETIHELDEYNPFGVIRKQIFKNMKRVGRWMSFDEFKKLMNTNKVQESYSGVTHVADPANAETFMKQAKKNTAYVEFDVPASSLKATSDKGVSQIIGPNSAPGRLAAKRGEAIPEMPTVKNIVHKATKFRY
ncbi:MAG: hypothetical protein GY820_43450 [Gammaproteobacteria bacterium]|nr:hypothetical protein [Gammaproteobacteria bacterium]